VPSANKLKADLANIQIIKKVDLKEGEFIELPAPRGGHSMSVMGNPSDYLMVFGGATENILDGDCTICKLKLVLNDLWIYHTTERLWSKLFVNGVIPSPRDGVLSTTVKADRLLLLYGGISG